MSSHDHIGHQRNGFGAFDICSKDNFSAFFLEWYAPLVCFISTIVKDLTVAEDIAEDAFIVLWERRENFDNIKVVKAFLYTTAKNASLNWLRSQNGLEKKNDQLKWASEGSDKFILEDIIRAEFLHELHAAVNNLPTQCRRIFNMLYTEGKSNKQVAAELKLSINTVNAQRTRGLAILRKKLLFLVIFFFMFV
ncbi:MAG TPA: RNA polymerase sigma-70 factor [Puia sp.]|nr:RNA polymerase sigma-70 factor [Puia sp.]